jgi:dihydrofolate reductase
MATIRGWIGASLDSYIATPDEGLEWLTRHDAADMGYDAFIAGIRTVVMGRATYDWIERSHYPWLYDGKRTIVVTSRPIETPKGPLETWSDVDALVAHLRALDDGDVWMIGGGKLQQAFIERGALDRLEIFIVPEIIGGGYPLFPPNGFARSVTLRAGNVLRDGIVHLDYEFAPVPAAV